MSLTKEQREAIIHAALNKTKSEFAMDVAARTTLTLDEVGRLAKNQAERERLAEVLTVVASARTANTAKAAAIRNITGGVEALVKIASHVI